jgi:hypothetical protein
MLKVDAESLWKEIHEAEVHRNKYLGEDYHKERKRYAGMGYRSDWSGDDPDLENHAFEWFSLFAPMLLSGNPRVKTSTTRVGSHQDLVKALGFALNRSIEETDMKQLNELLFYNWGIRWAAAITTPEPQPGFHGSEDPPYRPVTQSIPLPHYLSDPVSFSPDKDRWRSHMCIRDKNDLIDEALQDSNLGWNLDLIQSLAEGSGIHEARRHKEEFGIERGEVAYYEVWVPDHQLDKAKDKDGKEFTPKPEDGYHGTIFTIAYGGVFEPGRPSEAPKGYLRDPRPWWGPPEGPYTFGGAYIVQDECMPLAPIAAVRAQTDELNNHRNSLSRSMGSYKRGFAVSGMVDDALADKIKDFEDLHVFTLENADDIRQHLVSVEMGGLTEQQLAHFQFLRDSLDRNSGIADAQRGAQGKDITATATAVANQASLKRAGYLASKFIGFLEAILKKEGWFLVHDDRMKQSMGPRAKGLYMDEETGEPIEEAVWEGGLEKGETFEDWEIKIEFFSVAHTSEESEALRDQELDFIATSIVPLILQNPHMNWEAYMARRGERMDMPELAGWVDYDLARQIGALMLMANIQGGQQQGPQTQPRLPQDVGPKAASQPTGFSGMANLRGNNTSQAQPQRAQEVSSGAA